MAVPGRLKSAPGFALVVALVLMGFIGLLAVLLLSLLGTQAEVAGLQKLRMQAAFNARLALDLAVDALQTEMGDDRRITAPANLLFRNTAHGAMVGAFDASASPELRAAGDPVINYRAERQAAFRRWLVSGAGTRDLNFASSPLPERAVALFDHPDARFRISAEVLDLGEDGKIAWAVSDEGMKAPLHLGEDASERPSHRAIPAPAGAGVGTFPLLSQPTSGWPLRRARVTHVEDALLDSDYAFAGDPARLLPAFTTRSFGVLADVARGGLKTDLSLAFEMSDAAFDEPRWDGRPNPFRNGTAPDGERPVFSPFTQGAQEPAVPTITVNYDGRADETRTFTTGLPPTFDHLRSHYRLSREAGGSGEGLAVRAMSSRYWGGASSVGIAPVLNRVLFFFSPWVDPADPSVLRMVLTPIVVLWNPYDQPIKSPGFVVYQRLDIPVGWTVNVTRGGANAYRFGRSYIAGHLGRGLPTAPASGRSLEPYFLVAITGDGNLPPSSPLVIGPGEVRLFGPSSATPVPYLRTGSESQRTIRLQPINRAADLRFHGGFAVRLDQGVATDAANRWSFPLLPSDRLQFQANFARDRFHYLVTLENAGRILSGLSPEILSEVMVYRNAGVDAGEQFVNSPGFLVSQLNTPRPVAVLETFNRTATQPESLSNLLFTVNLRQRFANAMLTEARFTSGPHYQTDFRAVTDFLGSGLQVTPDAQRTYYGPTNESTQGRDRLPWFHLPSQPLLSLAEFQHADLVDSSFAPAHAFANSWASPYVNTRATYQVMRQANTSAREAISPFLAVYDHAFLLNRGLWDGFFFSSIAAGTDDGHESMIRAWLDEPESNPLPNPRMRLWLGGRTREEVEERLTGAARPILAAGHLLVAGAFNVNSTNADAWAAVLAALRQRPLGVRGVAGGRSTHIPGTDTTFHRISDPIGEQDDAWTGFRQLDDAKIRELAEAVVEEIRQRGPFLSLAEFVNRQLGTTNRARKGALQAAIDATGVNTAYHLKSFDASVYPFMGNLREPYTGVGLPGWLTQADVLQTLGSFLSARSDSFVVRALGEYRGVRMMLEATVQRAPDFLDPSDDPATDPATLLTVNRNFGRRFLVTEVREVSAPESIP